MSDLEERINKWISDNDAMIKRILVQGISLIFIIAAFSTILLYVSDIIEWNRFKETSVCTEAMITNITGYSTRAGSRHFVYVEYTDLDHKKHSGKLDHYSHGMYEGANVTIYYNKNNPDVFMTAPGDKLGNYMEWTFLFLGMAAALIYMIKKK